MKMANESITAAKGFLAAGISCGIKKSGKNDLGLIVCPTGAKAAGVFTTNKIVSPAVVVSKKHVKSGGIYAVVVNSVIANACTGEEGYKNAVKMCERTAAEIEEKSKNVLVASTGVIGEQLPIKKVLTGISKASKKLSASDKAGLDFTKAIMTTDRVAKQAVRRINISWKKVTIAGTIKGAGMIGPNMATMLCFITTDAAISKGLLGKALKKAVSVT